MSKDDEDSCQFCGDEEGNCNCNEIGGQEVKEEDVKTVQARLKKMKGEENVKIEEF